MNYYGSGDIEGIKDGMARRDSRFRWSYSYMLLGEVDTAMIDRSLTDRYSRQSMFSGIGEEGKAKR